MFSECQKPVARSVSVCCDGPAEPKAMSGAAPSWAADQPADRRADRRDELRAFPRDLLPWALTLGCLVFFACSAALTVSCLNGMERRLEEKIERTVLKLLEEERWGRDTPNARTVYKELFSNTIDTQFHKVKKRQAKPKSGNRNKKTKTAQKPPPLNFLHLVGYNSTQPIYDSEKDNSFVWDKTVNGRQENMEVILTHNGGVVQIRIKTRGVYLVYSQVAVNGQDYRYSRVPYDCAHQTVVDKPSKESRVLLRSLVTQHNYGERFEADPFEEHSVYVAPLDTKLQMGVFVLDPGDLISVRYLTGCGHYNYSLSKNFTYFGVVALNVFGN